MFHPILLAGALLVGLPILLHLIMRQEPKKLPFPAMRFLKVRRKTSQRRLRIRHLFLLLMRMLLIALMAVALFQPSLYSDRFNIRGEQPLAAVIVLDTTPSMGYTVGDKSRIDEGKRRASELLDALPPLSSVAVFDTSGAGRSGESTVADARKSIDAFTGARAVSRPVTAVLDQAYRHLQKVDSTSESADAVAMPRLIAVFSDRTLASWDASRLADLAEQKGRVPPPEVNAVYFDVGVDKPINLAITSATITPQIIAADQPAIINVTLTATGQDVDNVLILRLDGETTAERQPVKLAAGESKNFAFRRVGLKPGLHSAELTLFTPDAMLADNVRFLTFRVREPRQILTLVDDPSDATVWQIAMKAFKMFTSEVKSPRDVLEWKPEEWNRFEVVVVLDLKRPGELWPKLEQYLNRGGKVLLLPGGDELLREDYSSDEAKKILPGVLKELVAADPKVDVTWMWNSLNYQHPLLRPFREWQQQNNLDFIRFPPKALRYWSVQPSATENVVVSYNDAAKSPALLERGVGRGRLLMFTTPMDARRDGDGNFWNDYLQTSFYLVIANNAVRYLAGDSDDSNFNYLCGQAVTIELPVGLANKAGSFTLEGPGVTGSDALIKVNADGRLSIDRDKTVNAGNFVILGDGRKVIDGFSLNTDPSESELDRVPVESIAGLLGEDSVIPVDKGFNLADRIAKQFTQPVDLFPWLMVLVLLLYAGEGLLANRFYRNRAPSPDGVAPGKIK